MLEFRKSLIPEAYQDERLMDAFKYGYKACKDELMAIDADTGMRRCPFCGCSTMTSVKEKARGLPMMMRVYIQCDGCGAIGPSALSSIVPIPALSESAESAEKTAIEKWNNYEEWLCKKKK